MAVKSFSFVEGLPDGPEKAKCIVHLIRRQVCSPKGYAGLVNIVKNSNDQLVRFVAARALARFSDNFPPEALDVLIAAFENEKTLVPAYKPIADRSYDAIDEACICLMLQGKKQVDRLTYFLLEEMDKHTGFNASMISAAALNLAFLNTPIQPEISFDQLSDLQQTVLKTIATSRRAWRFNENLGYSLERLGLPGTRQELGDYCGIEVRKNPYRDET